MPTRNAMTITALLRPTGLTVDPRYVDVAHQALAQMQSMMAQYRLGFGQWLQEMRYSLSQPKEIGMIGNRDSTDTRLC